MKKIDRKADKDRLIALYREVMGEHCRNVIPLGPFRQTHWQGLYIFNILRKVSGFRAEHVERARTDRVLSKSLASSWLDYLINRTTDDPEAVVAALSAIPRNSDDTRFALDLPPNRKVIARFRVHNRVVEAVTKQLIHIKNGWHIRQENNNFVFFDCTTLNAALRINDYHIRHRIEAFRFRDRRTAA